MSNPENVFALSSAASTVARLSQQFAEPGSLAIFVDPALGDPFEEWRARAEIKTHLLPLPETKVVRSAWPYLLELPSDVDFAQELIRFSASVSMTEAIEWTRGTGAARSVCGWLSYLGEIQYLAQALSQKAVLAPKDSELQVFRFYDPRVLTHLVRYVRESQFFSGLPVLRQWTFFNVDAELVTLSPENEPESPAPIWFMTRDQREKVESIEVVNSVLRNVGAHSRRSNEIDTAFVRCREHYGWRDPDDLSAFATLAIRCHSRFDEHPKVQTQISELRRENESFAGWANSLDVGAWNEIAIELNEQEARGQK
ncbi:hypothetical protein AWB71_05348 [Caballeronia peredens]|nr:hypothetical protein AWB71_05348 [Caballeronia peredens]